MVEKTAQGIAPKPGVLAWLRWVALFVAMMPWMMPAVGQDYSGVYYIGSVGYNANTPDNNYYLCPTEGWCYYAPVDDFTGTANGKPFLTTYQCKTNGYHSGDSRDAVWTIEKASNSNYYYIRQASTG